MEEIGLKTLGRYIYNHVMSDRETYIYNLIHENNVKGNNLTIQQLWQQISNYFSQNNDEPPFTFLQMKEIINDMVARDLVKSV